MTLHSVDGEANRRHSERGDVLRKLSAVPHVRNCFAVLWITGALIMVVGIVFLRSDAVTAAGQGLQIAAWLVALTYVARTIWRYLKGRREARRP